MPCVLVNDETTAEGGADEGQLCGTFTLMRRGRHLLFTSKMLGGKERKSKARECIAVWGCVLYHTLLCGDVCFSIGSALLCGDVCVLFHTLCVGMCTYP